MKIKIGMILGCVVLCISLFMNGYQYFKTGSQFESFNESVMEYEKQLNVSNEIILELNHVLNTHNSHRFMWFGGESMDAEYLKLRVQRVMNELGVYDSDFMYLILGTVSTESDLGYNIETKNDLGSFMVNRNTLQDMYDVFFKKNPNYKKVVDSYRTPRVSREFDARYNVDYGIGLSICYYLYRGVDGETDLSTLEKRADVWKKEYNSHLGAGHPKHFKKKYTLYYGD